MSELSRLKDEDGPLAQLLCSADDDAPSPRAKAAAAAAIGLAAGLGKGAGAGASAASAAKTTVAAKVTTGLAIKVTAVIVTVGTTVGVHQIATRRHDEVQVASAPERVPMPTPAPARVAAPVAVPVPVAETVPDPVPVPAAVAAAVAAPPQRPRPIPRAPAAATISTPATAASPATAPVPSLTEELALLDTAVAALHRHDPHAALAALATYDQRFANGALVPEATVARIEATLAIGDSARARELATGFLAAHARSPLAARVRALVDTP